MDVIYGYIERITFQSPETGFTVAKAPAAFAQDRAVMHKNLFAVLANDKAETLGAVEPFDGAVLSFSARSAGWSTRLPL